MPRQQTDRIDRIRAASRRLVRAFGFLDRTLAGTDLSPSAVHAIIETGHATQGGEPVTAKRLGEILGLEKSTVSRLVAGLVRRGELTERVSPEDGREKWLSLAARGRATLRAIDRHARDQVETALAGMSAAGVGTVVEGLERYADALSGGTATTPAMPAIREGYAIGLLASVIGMHATYYARESGFGEAFETRVAGDLAAFMPRAARSRNGIWHAVADGHIVGAIAIDGEDLGENRAHLRWFVVADGFRRSGLGRNLLETALTFCDAQGFAETWLWTFRGLDAARALYERHGFALAEEWQGDQWGKQVMEQRFVRPRGGAWKSPATLSQ